MKIRKQEWLNEPLGVELQCSPFSLRIAFVCCVDISTTTYEGRAIA